MAAELVGVPRVDFLVLCGRHGVSVFQQMADEVADDLTAIDDARRR